MDPEKQENQWKLQRIKIVIELKFKYVLTFSELFFSGNRDEIILSGVILRSPK